MRLRADEIRFYVEFNRPSERNGKLAWRRIFMVKSFVQRFSLDIAANYYSVAEIRRT